MLDHIREYHKKEFMQFYNTIRIKTNTEVFKTFFITHQNLCEQ